MQFVSEDDHKILSALAEQSEPIAIDELAKLVSLDQAKVSAACFAHTDSGEVALCEETWAELRLGPKGKAITGTALPERVIIEALAKASGESTIDALSGQCGLEKKEIGQTLRWLKQKKWAEQQGPALRLTDTGKAALDKKPGADEQLFTLLAKKESVAEAELPDLGIDLAQARQLLSGRKGLIDERPRKTRFVSLTEAGKAFVAGGIAARPQVNQLTPELLRSGQWREVELRPYDVTAAAQPAYPGKVHPLVSTIEQTRGVFSEMGFSEIDGPIVESGFWCFDTLFSPQDHPARDMQDTFYIGRPAQCDLPEETLVTRVKRTHEDGGDTGSVGWRYSWDKAIAQRPLLRTHTTAATIRNLADNPEGPRKVFMVGPVFRRETVDYKHLPVFHQVEGIIVDEKASFSTLLGTLAAFYRKMGFERFSFRPGFFPYTEPSVEVFVWLESKRDWVEMGGAGMFRPEVTLPLGCKAPVLAWGLGLERLAMFRYQLSNISELYRARLRWLKETPLCR